MIQHGARHLLTQRGITMLTLHRVGDRDRSRLSPNESLKVSGGFLEDFVRQARRHGFRFIDLDEAHAQIARGRVKPRQLVLTFDDGYRDNLTHARPLLAQLGVPFTVYVTTSFADREARLWWHALEDVILASPRLELSDGTRHQWSTLAEAEALFMHLRERVLTEGGVDPAGFVERLAGRPIDYHRYVDDVALSWDDVRTLADCDGVTVGAHTVHHRPLSRLSADEARWEMFEGRARLERQIRRPVRHFAYPYGGLAEAGPREYALAAACGYATATTTREGIVGLRHRDALHALPRLTLDEHVCFAPQSVAVRVAAFQERRKVARPPRRPLWTPRLVAKQWVASMRDALRPKPMHTQPAAALRRSAMLTLLGLAGALTID